MSGEHFKFPQVY